MNKPYRIILCQKQYSAKFTADIIREALKQQFLGYAVSVEVDDR